MKRHELLVHHTQSEGYASQTEESCEQHEGDRAAEFYRAVEKRYSLRDVQLEEDVL